MSAWWFALFPLAATALVGPCLTGARILGAFDDIFYWHPFLRVAQDGWHRFGQPPLWLPGIFGGIPFAESLGPSVWYPTDLLAWSLGIPSGIFYAWDAWLHLSLAGIGSAWLARRMGASRGGAMFGGLCYLMSGHVLGTFSVGIATFVRGCAIIPWIAGLALRAAEDGRPRSWAAMSAVCALLPLGATHQFFAYLVVALPLLIVGGTPGRRAWPALAGCAAALGGAAALSALTVMPAIRAVQLSLRADSSHGWTTMASLPIAGLPGLLLPGIWGSGDLWFGPATAASTEYLGLIPFAFAAYAAATNSRAAKRWVPVMIVSMILALGPATPAGRVLGSIPLMSSFRVSTRWLVFVQLAVSVLAALGLGALLRGAARAKRRLTAIWIVVALVGGSVWLVRDTAWANVEGRPWVRRAIAARPEAEPAMRRAFGRAFAGIGARGIAAAGLTALTGVASPVVIASAWCAMGAADLVIPALPTLRSVYARPGEIAAIAAVPRLPPASSGSSRVFTEEPHYLINARLPAGLPWVQGYHGAPLASFGTFWDAAVYGCTSRPGPFAWFGSRYYLVKPGERWDLADRGTVTNYFGQVLSLREDPAPLPRAFFVTRVDAAGTDDEVLAALCRTPASARRVYVAGPRGRALAGRKAPGAVGTLDLTPNRITADVATAGDGFLFFSEAWYPAWTGFVDGVRVPIARVNVMFRGIAVPEGRHTVEMVYSSLPFRIGLWISLLGWAGLAGAAVSRAGRALRPREGLR
ncbi:MAG: hypothetical protein AAB152_01190 [Candidatus Coatesbacteria bacterium]